MAITLSAENEQVETLENQPIGKLDETEYQIPFSGELDGLVDATIFIAVDHDDRCYRSSFKTVKSFDSLDGTQHNWGGEAVTRNGREFETPSEALLTAGEALIDWWRQYDAKADQRFEQIIETIEQYCERVVEGWDAQNHPAPAEEEPSIEESQIDETLVSPAIEPTEAVSSFKLQESEIERELCNAYLRQKEIEADLKSCRKTVELISKQLSRHREDGPQYMPLFDGADTATTDAAEMPEAKTANAESTAPSFNTEAWRTIPLSETIISNGILAILQEYPENPIVTVGDLADWTAEKPLTKIPRIGKGKAEKIEAAMEEFWAAHQTE